MIRLGALSVVKRVAGQAAPRNGVSPIHQRRGGQEQAQAKTREVWPGCTFSVLGLSPIPKAPHQDGRSAQRQAPQDVTGLASVNAVFVSAQRSLDGERHFVSPRRFPRQPRHFQPAKFKSSGADGAHRAREH